MLYSCINDASAWYDGVHTPSEVGKVAVGAGVVAAAALHDVRVGGHQAQVGKQSSALCTENKLYNGILYCRND